MLAAPTRPNVRYVLHATVLAALGFGVYFYPYPEGSLVEGAVRAFLKGYAHAACALVSIVEPGVRVAGATITGPRFSMQIVRTCDAMEINILLLAALLAFPLPIFRRVAWSLVALVALVLMNLARLCLLYRLGAHAPSYFEPVHQTVAPLVLVAGAVGIFFLATRRGKRLSPGTRRAPVS